jgi:putative transcriptional regulator
MKNKLKLYRFQHSLTQEDLADKINVSRQTIIAIENNKYLPSITLAFKLSRLFQVNIEDIFIYQEEK